MKTNERKPSRFKRVFKRCLYALSVLALIFGVGIYGAIRYAKSQLFLDTPNTLTFQGEFHSVPFQWSVDESDEYIEPHAAILVPVTVPGVSETLYMQFDTGSANTFLRSGSLESLKEHGVDFELTKTEKGLVLDEFEINVGRNRVKLTSGQVMIREGISIDWSKPVNIIGSFGADFLDQKICEIDFPNREFRFHEKRSQVWEDLGEFTPFKFKGRRIILPATIGGSEVEVFYDSGCSAFGLLTSKYQYDHLTTPNDSELNLAANRFGESIPIHHKASDLQITFGSTDLSLKRVSYAEMYNFLQTALGRFIGGGFLGNKSLLESTLIIDAKASEFLVLKQSPIQIPFTLTEHNNISVEAIVNNQYKVPLMFHTAASDISLTERALEKMPEIEFDQEGNSESWGGSSRIQFGSGHSLSLGKLNLTDITIFKCKQSGHGTGGKFGPRQFKRRFIEVDFEQSMFTLHTSLPKKVSEWTCLDMRQENGMLFISGSILDGEDSIEQRFMIHSGYSGFALLDDEFVSNHPYVNELKVIEESELTDSGGNKLKTRKATLPRFSIDGFDFENVPVSFFSGAIGRQKFSVLGGDFLKRFNVVFDFENSHIYLKENTLRQAANR